MARLEARQAALSGKTDEEKVDVIFDQQVNSIAHEQIALKSLVQNQNSAYGRKIDLIQNQFLDEIDAFNKERKVENIERRQLAKDKLKYERRRGCAKVTKAIRRERAEKMESIQ